MTSTFPPAGGCTGCCALIVVLPPIIHVLKGPSILVVARFLSDKMIIAPTVPRTKATTATARLGPGSTSISEAFTEYVL